MKLRPAALAAVWACAVTPALAQTVAPTTERRAIFGGDVQPARRSLAGVTMSLSGGSDDHLGIDQGEGVAPGRAYVGGRYSVLDAALSLRRLQRRAAFSLHATGSGRHYPSLDGFLGSSHSVAADVAVNAGRRTLFRARADEIRVSSLAVDALFRRTPDESGSPLGSLSDPTTFGGESSSLGSARTSYGAFAALDRFVGRQSSFSFTGSVRRSQRDRPREAFDERRVGVEFEQGIGRRAAVGFGYAFRQGAERRELTDTSIWGHDAHVSARQEWRHSAVRRTAVIVSGGPFLTRRTTIGAGLEPGGELRVAGTVALVHDFSHSWTLQASYRQGSGILSAAEFSQTAALDLSGAMGRRIRLGVVSGYESAETGAALRHRSETLFGSARLQFACSRYVAVYGQYLAYQYGFARTPGATTPAAERLDRRGLQAGVTTWVPLGGR